MPDILPQTSPLPAKAFVGTGVTIGASGSLTRYSMRARDPARLSELIGMMLPTKIGAMADDILKLGPDEYLALLPEGTSMPSGEGEPVSIVEVTSRAVGISVAGPRAAEVLMAGCALDLSRMAIGRGCRTVFETTEVIVVRKGDQDFHVEVWRSFAPWLWEALVYSS